MPYLTTFTSFDIPGDPDMIENGVTGEVYVRKDLFVQDMMQQIRDSGGSKEQIQKDIEHTHGVLYGLSMARKAWDENGGLPLIQELEHAHRVTLTNLIVKQNG